MEDARLYPLGGTILLKRHYIRHEDVQTPENGIALFGPFEEDEVQDRLCDAYADLLAGCGNVDGVQLTDKAAARLYINPREYWMQQLHETEDFYISTNQE